MTASKRMSFHNIPALLRYRANLHPLRLAARFIGDNGTIDSVSYGELYTRSLAVAATLRQLRPVATPQADQGCSPPSHDDQRATSAAAPRVVLLFPPGIDFLPAFFGAQIAGWIPVTTCYPKPHRSMPRIDSVVKDCTPALMLTNQETLSTIDRNRLSAQAAALTTITVEECIAQVSASSDETVSSIDDDPCAELALLQYTSGSTNDPKGVMVSHENIMANLRMIAEGFHLEMDHSDSNLAPTSVSWLPFFHDMGLVGGVLAPIYLGLQSVFLSPQSIVQRPLRWLQAISDYRAIVSGGPNFAYELCADRIAPDQMSSLDLGSWQLAFCGAEPIRARALQTFEQRFSSVGFRSDAFYPCYGLAEATLIVSGGDGPGKLHTTDVSRNALRAGRVEIAASRQRNDSVTMVDCGQAMDGTVLRIVHPETAQSLPEGAIGEIWLHGPSIARGYWNRPEENQNRFCSLAANTDSRGSQRWLGWFSGSKRPGPTDDRLYFRTGDLGFLHQGHLYVSGRIKDLIIIRGRNYAPQDIEASVIQLGGPIENRVVAFPVEGPRAEGLGIVVEVSRSASHEQLPLLVRDIRRAIIDEHEIDPRTVLICRPATIPMTTSGKVQRSATAKLYSDALIEARYQWTRSGSTEAPPLPIPRLPESAKPSDREWIQGQVCEWLGQWLITRIGITPQEISADRRFDDYGLDSLAAVELSGELEDWSGVELTPTRAWENPTIADMSRFVAQSLSGGFNESAEPIVATAQLS